MRACVNAKTTGHVQVKPSAYVRLPIVLCTIVCLERACATHVRGIANVHCFELLLLKLDWNRAKLSPRSTTGRNFPPRTTMENPPVTDVREKE